jgi:DNA helicase-2/ATP-dependent DNA helicase PcrA
MQREAVFHINGPLLVLAGAGSGKTSVLTNRIANMVKYGNAYHSDYIPENLTEGDLQQMRGWLEQKKLKKSAQLPEEVLNLVRGRRVLPSSILSITFTNKAAKEMKDRVEKLVGAASENMWISTFHSACVRILRRDADKVGFDRNFVIYDTSDQQTVIKDCLKELNLNEKNFPPKLMLDYIGKAKDELIEARTYAKMNASDFRMSRLRLFMSFTRRSSTKKCFDFDDIIMMTIKLLLDNPPVLDYYQKRFRYILVDEYQDTNTAQYSLVSLLAQENRNLCVVGDDDQSIYGWRGANIRNILDFEKEFRDCKVIKLEQNYRSTQMILDAANSVIKNNTGRKAKSLWTDNLGGDKIQFLQGNNEYEEALFIAKEIKRLTTYSDMEYKDFAILYRINAQSRVIEEMLMRMPFRIRLWAALNSTTGRK